MLDSKGQSLILFVLVLPILLLILILVIDVGRIIVLKQELNNISKITLDYGLDNLDKDKIDDELVDVIKLNNNEIDNIDVYVEDNKIYVEMSEKSDGVFSSLIDISIFNVKTAYVGYIENNEKRIERMGD